jgi:hypothetical protein
MFISISIYRAFNILKSAAAKWLMIMCESMYVHICKCQHSNLRICTYEYIYTCINIFINFIYTCIGFMTFK